MNHTEPTMIRKALIAAFALTGFAHTASAQNFDLTWHSIDGGGGTATGGNLELFCTIGQPDAGVVMTGGTFELVGGFWTIALGDSPPCDPCDMNCDGEVNAFDIEPFLDLLFGGGDPCGPCAGDTNGDGNVDAFDIEPFLECLFP